MPLAADRAHDVADGLFARHATVFGDDLDRYRGHVHRVIGLVALQAPLEGTTADAVGVAGFFHDAGLWFDGGTWDYLPPSIRHARAELGGADDHGPLVAAMIDEHHRVRHAHHPDPLVEAFRRADLTDVTGGLVGAPGVPRAAYRALTARHPATGFRPMLLRAFRRGLREDPRRPLPMLRL
ncbi:hypothetical protein [Pseudonocardia sp.]|uniref:hypothetical protein n=1 Tax=Pseudonocardia sp. TaxID=60912 RepID=UPI002631CD19|nr:hypothetical protein [Pseudonocardia sp.]